LFQIKDFIIAT